MNSILKLDKMYSKFYESIIFHLIKIGMESEFRYPKLVKRYGLWRYYGTIAGKINYVFDLVQLPSYDSPTYLQLKPHVAKIWPYTILCLQFGTFFFSREHRPYS